VRSCLILSHFASSNPLLSLFVSVYLSLLYSILLPNLLTYRLPTTYQRCINSSQIDDDSTVFSTRKSFIEAVAAIVIQTAARRFLATQAVKYLREQQQQQQQLLELVQQQEEDSPNADNQLVESHHFQTRYVQAAVIQKSESKKSGNALRNVSFAESSIDTSRTDQQIEELAHQMYEMAAIRIQSIFRGFWARDSLEVDHYCATLIQKHVRRYLCRLEYLDTLHRVIIVQSVWRRNLAREYSADMLACIMIIQSTYRGYRARRDFQLGLVFFALRNEAATKIQARWRAYVCEMAFIRKLVDIIIAQSVVRMWIAKRQIDLMRKGRSRRQSSSTPTSVASLPPRHVNNKAIQARAQPVPQRPRSSLSSPLSNVGNSTQQPYISMQPSHGSGMSTIQSAPSKMERVPFDTITRNYSDKSVQTIKLSPAFSRRMSSDESVSNASRLSDESGSRTSHRNENKLYPRINSQSSHSSRQNSSNSRQRQSQSPSPSQYNHMYQQQDPAYPDEIRSDLQSPARPLTPSSANKLYRSTSADQHATNRSATPQNRQRTHDSLLSKGTEYSAINAVSTAATTSSSHDIEVENKVSVKDLRRLYASGERPEASGPSTPLDGKGRPGQRSADRSQKLTKRSKSDLDLQDMPSLFVTSNDETITTASQTHTASSPQPSSPPRSVSVIVEKPLQSSMMRTYVNTDNVTSRCHAIKKPRQYPGRRSENTFDELPAMFDATQIDDAIDRIIEKVHNEEPAEKPHGLTVDKIVIDDIDRESCSGITSADTEDLEDTIEKLIEQGNRGSFVGEDHRKPLVFYRKKVIRTLNEAYANMMSELEEVKSARRSSRCSTPANDGQSYK
jgi:IQ calmodulin-binding motif